MTATALRFTSTDAYEAHEDGEPITMTWQAAHATIRQHGSSVYDFYNETYLEPRIEIPVEFDAWVVLSWLGY